MAVIAGMIDDVVVVVDDVINVVVDDVINVVVDDVINVVDVGGHLTAPLLETITIFEKLSILFKKIK